MYIMLWFSFNRDILVIVIVKVANVADVTLATFVYQLDSTNGVGTSFFRRLIIIYRESSKVASDFSLNI